VTEERTLEQHEVDQLVLAIREGKIPSGSSSLIRLLDVEPLDLADPTWGQDRIVRRRLRILDMIFDRLGPAFQITLTKSLKFPVRAESEGVVLQKFGDLRQQYRGSACLYEVMRLDPLRGYSLLVFEPTVLYALVDALMGGLGVGEVPAERDISDIELSLVYRATTDLLRDFEYAWRPWFPLNVEPVRTERSGNVMSTIPDEEVCHVGTIMVSGDVLSRSPIRFVLPYASLEPLLDATSSRGGDELDPNWRNNLEQNLRSVSANVSVELGRTDVRARRVKALSVGDVIELDRRVDEDLDVKVEGETVLKGRLGKSHHQYAVRVAERREIKRNLFDRTNGQTLVRKGLITHEQLAVARVDEMVNRRPLLDSIVSRGWVERRVLETALGG
jgi:flagellar motor switch protein FliM